MGLENCPRCGRLFANNFRDICPACIKEIDNEYERCVDYLKKNRNATMTDLSEETKVTVRQIIRFIREGRISIVNFPNITFGCETCGAPIRDGNMCIECRHRLSTEMKNSQLVDARKPDGGSEDSTQGAYRIGERLRDRL